MFSKLTSSLQRTRWALIFACLSMFVLGLSDNIRGPLFPELLKYFNLTNSQGSLSFAFASTAAFFGNAAAAFILKRIQLDRLLAISILLMGAGLFAMGSADTFAIYLIGAVVYGFSIGATGVAQNLLIAENSAPEHQTRALSTLHGLYGLSSLVAPFLASRAPTWFATHFSSVAVLSGWQSSFLLTSVLAVLIFFLILRTHSEPRFAPSIPHDEAIHGKRSPLSVLLWFAGFFASYVGAEILVSTRLALYMRTYFNMSLESSSDYVTGFFIFLFIGRSFFIFKSFKLALKIQLNLSLGLSLLSLLLGLWLHPFFLALIGLTMAPFYPLAIVYISEITGFQKRRFLTFVMGLQSFCVIFMHAGVGYLTDKYGLFYAFYVGIFLLLGSILCLNLHPKVAD